MFCGATREGSKGKELLRSSGSLARRFAARKPISCLRSRPPLASLVPAFRLPTVFCCSAQPTLTDNIKYSLKLMNTYFTHLYIPAFLPDTRISNLHSSLSLPLSLNKICSTSSFRDDRTIKIPSFFKIL